MQPGIRTEERDQPLAAQRSCLAGAGKPERLIGRQVADREGECRVHNREHIENKTALLASAECALVPPGGTKY